jgi:hypothetical protein
MRVAPLLRFVCGVYRRAGDGCAEGTYSRLFGGSWYFMADLRECCRGDRGSCEVVKEY